MKSVSPLVLQQYCTFYPTLQVKDHWSNPILWATSGGMIYEGDSITQNAKISPWAMSLWDRIWKIFQFDYLCFWCRVLFKSSSNIMVEYSIVIDVQKNPNIFSNFVTEWLEDCREEPLLFQWDSLGLFPWHYIVFCKEIKNPSQENDRLCLLWLAVGGMYWVLTGMCILFVLLLLIQSTIQWLLHTTGYVFVYYTLYRSQKRGADIVPSITWHTHSRSTINLSNFCLVMALFFWTWCFMYIYNGLVNCCITYGCKKKNT